MDDPLHLDFFENNYIFPSISAHQHQQQTCFPPPSQQKLIQILKQRIIQTDTLVRENKTLKRRVKQLKTMTRVKNKQYDVLKNQFDIMVENEVRNRLRKTPARTTRHIKINKNKGKTKD